MTTISADVVVIGGGAIGAAAAYYLARENLDVLLVEKTGLAEGSSGRCDGGVIVCDAIPGYDAELKKMSQDLFPVLVEELEYDIHWERSGSLLVIENETEMEVAKVYSRQLADRGLPSQILDHHEVLDEEPNLARDISGGMLMACDGSVNPMALSQGLAHGARRLGARIMTGTEVRNIVQNASGQVERVETSGCDIRTPCVVNAAGVWAPVIGKMVGLEIPITPRQGQILVGERTFRICRRNIVQEFGYNMVKFETKGYQRSVTPEMEKYGVALVFESTDAGNFLIGSSRVFAGWDLSGNVDLIKCISQRALRFLPVLERVNIIRSYAGWRPYTPDHYPIVSNTDVQGFYIAAGHEGNGIGLAPITGKLIAELICEKTASIDPGPLAFSRYKKRPDGSAPVSCH